MRYPLVVFVAILLAAAGLGTVDSPAKAAGGDYASRYGGGKILLFAREKRLLTLHNNVPKNHGLKPFCVHPALESRPCSFEGHDPTTTSLTIPGGGTKTRARASGASVTAGPTAERTSDTALLQKACSAPGCAVPSTALTYWMGGST